MALLCFAGCCAGLLAAEESGSGPYLEIIEVDVLNLEVVVTDRDGQRMEGLSKEDFELFVDGEPKAIDYFAEIRSGQALAEGEAPSQRALPRNDYLIFVDEFFSLQRDKDRVLDALAEELADLPQGDRVAVAAWRGDAVEILSGWQDSREAIGKTVEAARGRQALGLEREIDRRRFGVDGSRAPGRGSALSSRLGSEERAYASVLAGQLQGAVGAASAAMRGLHDEGGRQVLLLLAGGWPYDLLTYVAPNRSLGQAEIGVPDGETLYGPLIQTAQLLDFTIQTVDVAGPQTQAGASAGLRGPRSAGAGFLDFQAEADVHRSLQTIADETGGLAWLDGDREEVFSGPVDDRRSYYWLGFTPGLHGEDRKLSIEVRVRGEGLTTRHRRAYFDLSETARVELAVESSLLFGPARESPVIDVVVSEVEKAGRGTVEARLTFLIRTSALTRESDGEGWRAAARLFIGALDENGGRTEVEPIDIAIRGREEPSADDTATYERTVRLKWKTQRLSAALHDLIGGRTFIEVVDR